MVYILLPTRNRLNFLKKNIGCIRNQSFKDISIVVVDDGSTDGSDQWLAQQTDIHSIRGNGNLWWTGAMRKGVEYILAKAKNDDFIFTMNDDAEFDSDLLKTLVNCQKELGVSAIVGSVCFLNRTRQKVVNSGAVVRLDDNWGFGTKLLLPENYQTQSPQKVDLLSGKGTLIPIRVFKKVGNFDKDLPHYGADYEFSYRAKKNGFQPYICYQAEVYNQQQDGGYNDVKQIRTLKDIKEIFFSKRSKRNIWYRLVYLSKTTPWWNTMRGIGIISIELMLHFFKIFYKP